MEEKQGKVTESETQHEAEEAFQGQAEILQQLFHFADSMALKCAVELRIADIIHSQGRPIPLYKIASAIDSPSPDIPCLARIMRFLVLRRIFTVHHPSDGGEPLYGLSRSSRWILHDSDQTLAPMIALQTHPWLMAPWHCLSRCVKEGGVAFQKAHGREIWEFALVNPEFNKIFNDGMACKSKVVARAILDGYKDGFSNIASLVDVGGGTGCLVAEIVKAHPHVKGINFDLPHVVATAPRRDGVEHVGGDMFKRIPKADAVVMKWIMHDWSDEDCVKILRNCREAIPAGRGKLIIVEGVLKMEGSCSKLEEVGVTFDLLMIAHSSGGKERTEVEWSIILQKGGFPRYNIVTLAALPSIIEAYPQ